MQSGTVISIKDNIYGSGKPLFGTVIRQESDKDVVVWFGSHSTVNGIMIAYSIPIKDCTIIEPTSEVMVIWHRP